MGEQLTKGRISAESIVRVLPLLPLVGFVVAFCYEGVFFYFLDIELRQILTLSDIVEASALNILPAIPLLSLGIWLGSTLPLEKAKTKRERMKNFVLDFPYRVTQIVIIVSAIMYLLFGFEPGMGFGSFVLVMLAIIIRLIIFPYLVEIDFRTLIPIGFFLIVAAVFCSMGHGDAHKIRFGDRSKLPLVTTKAEISDAATDKFRLVRRLSSGMLVATKAEDRLWFIRNDDSSVLTFKINSTPFRGIFCGGFDWCPISYRQTK